MTKKATPRKNNLKPKRAATKILAKHKNFVEEYLTDFNGSRAYRAVFATNSERNARSAASQLLATPLVKEYLEKRVAERNEALKVDQTYVIDIAKKVLESNYYQGVQYLTQEEIDEMPEDIQKLVQAIDFTKTKRTTRHGNSSETEIEEERFKVTFMSKDKAHEMLAKHTGTYAKDNERTLNVKGFAEALAGLDI